MAGRTEAQRADVVSGAPARAPLALIRVLRLLNPHRSGPPGLARLKRCAELLEGGVLVERVADLWRVGGGPIAGNARSLAALGRLFDVLGLEALMVSPQVRAYELAALWTLLDMPSPRLKDIRSSEWLKQRGVRRLEFRGGVAGFAVPTPSMRAVDRLAVVCSALELALNEEVVAARRQLTAVALANARSAAQALE